MSTMQTFDFAASLPEVMRKIRFAIVRKSSDEETKFAANVAANRGAIARSFLTVDEAQMWLESTETTPNKPDAGEV